MKKILSKIICNLFYEAYFLSGGKWRPLNAFQEGMKIEKVKGVHLQLFCKCGNELIHSKSFITERIINKSLFVWDFKCTFCGENSHWNPTIGGPLVLPSNENGVPKS